MKNKLRILKNVMIASVGISTLIGCGSAGTSNDQGISFTLYGVYNESACSSIFGGSLPLSNDPEANGSGVGVTAFAGVQNNLAQGLRTRRANMTYYVEGGEIQPPPTSQALGIVLAPGTTPNNNSSLPDGFGGANASNTGCVGFELVPPEILSYINLNRSSFPELPFKMRVEVSVSGIGTAGDEYTSNPIDVAVEFVQDNIIAPTPGEVDGTTGDAASEIDESTIDNGLEGGTDGEVIPVIPGTDQPVSE